MSETAAPRLARVLTLKDLIVYGIVLITPLAPVGIYGITARMSHGHTTATILLAMVAMMLTASSYGRMAALYPSAGSAYAYVGRGLNPHLGFLAGWAMFLDYLVVPVINTIYPALTLQRLMPQIPYPVWVTLVAAAITAMNLREVRFTTRANQALLAAMSVVIGAFVVLAVAFVSRKAGWGGLISPEAILNPSTVRLQDLATATSLAALTYIGFDGVTTLAEETRNPRRTVHLATVLVCLVTGLLSAVETYLAHLVWPDPSTFPNLETAFLDICARAGGEWLFQAMAVVLIVSCFGSGLTGQASASRLLYGMGRDQVLPRRLFGYLSPRTGTPTRNVLLLGALTLVVSLTVDYERAVGMLNFGAFLAFMGVNLAALRRGYWSAALGFLCCLAIWLSLPPPATIAGGLWFLAGLVYAAARTRLFRTRPVMVDFSEGDGQNQSLR